LRGHRGVERARRRRRVRVPTDRGPWCRISADPTLRDRYVDLVADAEAVRIRTPSRHRLYGALRDRCGSEVADETVRLLDAGNDPLDRGARASGRTPPVRAAPPSIATCGRCCEDAGLGSSATFTRIKRDLVEAGLLGTESVSQPVGRPRQRLVARGALADASSPAAARRGASEKGL